MGTILTEDYVLARGGSYELSSVFHLDLTNSALTSVGSILDSCSHLIRLDVSHNLLDSLSFVDSLSELQWLNASQNTHISSIESLVSCVSLETLFLCGTNIDWEDFLEQFKVGKQSSLRRQSITDRPLPANQTSTVAFQQAARLFKEGRFLLYCNGYHRDEVAFLNECTEQSDSLLIEALTNGGTGLTKMAPFSMKEGPPLQQEQPRLNARIGAVNNTAQNMIRDQNEAMRRYT